MLKKYKDGMHYTIPNEWAEKLEKYDRIVEILKGSSPYQGNRATCNAVRTVVEKEIGHGSEGHRCPSQKGE